MSGGRLGVQYQVDTLLVVGIIGDPTSQNQASVRPWLLLADRQLQLDIVVHRQLHAVRDQVNDVVGTTGTERIHP